MVSGWGQGQTRTSSKEHKQWAAQVKRNAGGRCQLRYSGCEGYADEADHVIPVAEGGAEFDVANGQGACSFCHEIKTQAEAARARQVMYDRARYPESKHPGLL